MDWVKTLQAGSFQFLVETAYENALSQSVVLLEQDKLPPSKANVALVKPEKVTAYEVGYRGLVDMQESQD